MSDVLRFCALVAVLLINTPQLCARDRPSADHNDHRLGKQNDQLSREIEYGAPIDRGRLIAHGSVVTGPYRVGFRGRDVFIDDIRIATLHGFRDANRRSWHGRSASSHFVAEVERRLYDGQTLIVFDPKTRVYLEEEEAVQFLSLLADATTDDDRIRATLDCAAGVDDRTGLSQIPTSQWRTALADFEVTESLRAYVSSEETESDDESDFTATDETESHTAQQPMYVLNVVGMLLVAVSLGTLLGFRPPVGVAWSQVVDSGQTPRLIGQSMGLIVALSSFDLTATILASSAGGFAELNPLAGSFLQNPMALSAFKITATGLAVLILWKRRAYAGAQKAAWWVCLILTLVTMRWVAVQSLFYVQAEAVRTEWVV